MAFTAAPICQSVAGRHTLLLLLLLLAIEMGCIVFIVADILVRVWSVLLTPDVSDTLYQTHLVAALLRISPHLILELLLHLSLRDIGTL